jgi:C4-dicarboxylate-specific signal transduction histidine kinase
MESQANPKPLRGLRKAFGDLRVRSKLIVLHNLFFLGLAGALYLAALGRTRLGLAVVLAAGYGLAVLLLELLIMPVYVYRPLGLLLNADESTRRGDREHELISSALIFDDELGQIMRSRNAAIAELRKRESDLAEALAALERKNEMLDAARRSLADQDRLVSVGLMSASIAHELNTPLAVLHGSVEKLQETVKDAAAQERLARMQRVTERLRKISGNLLDFARPPRYVMAPVEVRGMVEEAWGLVSIDEKAGAIRFENSVPAGDLVTGDTDRLVQVFVNLLRNALGAVKLGGSIRVHSRRITAESQAWEVIDVDDDGPGIPYEVLPQIFEAFVTSRLDARGTGLGLTVAAGIVQQHAGAIEASNRSSGGARLEVRLPAAAQTVAARGDV